MVRRNIMKSKVLRLLGFVIGIILCVWFVIPFAVAGVINIGNGTGIILSSLWILYMVFLPSVHKWIKSLWGKKKVCWILRIISVFAMICIILVIVETGCMIRACNRAPAKKATAVVLGCRVYGERPSLSLVERLEAAYAYLSENPEAVCVLSGGKGDGENISEAECMYRWLVEKGIDSSRIYKEEKSTSTEENIAYSKQIIEENGLNENLAIITSEYHTYRAGIIVENAQLSYGTVPAKTALWLFPTFYVRELYAILAEWIF